MSKRLLQVVRLDGGVVLSAQPVVQREGVVVESIGSSAAGARKVTMSKGRFFKLESLGYGDADNVLVLQDGSDLLVYVSESEYYRFENYAEACATGDCGVILPAGNALPDGAAGSVLYQAGSAPWVQQGLSDGGLALLKMAAAEGASTFLGGSLLGGLLPIVGAAVAVTCDDRTDPGHSAVVVDGYIAGATVTRANGSGNTVKTDSNGRFEGLTGSGEIVVTGGTDLSTGQPFQGQLRAPDTATVVTPLTTLVTELEERGLSREQALTKVKAFAGLADNTSFDLLNQDPLALAQSRDVVALQVQKAGVKTATALQAMSKGVTGFSQAIDALADELMTRDTVDLADHEQLRSLASKIDADHSNIFDAAKVANAVTAILSADSVSAIAQEQKTILADQRGGDYDNVAPKLVVTQESNQIAVDGVINAAERTAGVVLSGTTEAGRSVTIATGTGTNVSVTADAATGAWSATVPAANLPQSGNVTFTVTSTDAAGNTATVTRTVSVDTAAPNLVVTQTTANIAGDGVINAAERTAGVVLSGTTEVGRSVTIATGTGTNVTVTADATTGAWSATVPAANLPESGNVTFTVTSADAAGNTATVTRTVSVDTTAPELVVTQDNNQIAVDGVINAAERTAGVVLSGTTEAGRSVTIATGSGTNVTVTADATTGAWSATVPAANLPESGNVTFTVTSADAAGNTATVTRTVSVDTAAPTLSSTAPSTALSTVAGTAGNSAGETITLTITFDGPVNGLTSGSNNTVFTVGGTGVAATWGGSNNSNTRTLTYTVQAGQNGQAAIDEAALKAALIAGISDAAGNAFSYTLNSGSIPNIDITALPVIDTTAPTLTITDNVAGTATGPVLFTFRFSEPMIGFTAEKVTVSGGAKGLFTQVNDSTYTLVVTPPANSTTPIVVDVPADAATDSGGNTLAGAVQAQQAVATPATMTADTTAPTLTITDNFQGAAGGPVTFTFRFSEPVAGFTADQVAVQGGAKGAFSAIDASTYTLIVTPLPNSIADITVSVAAGGAVTDLAGNALAQEVVATQAVNTVVPVIVAVQISGATGALNNTLNEGDTLTATVKFDKAMVLEGSRPQLALMVGDTEVLANYVSGAGSDTLSFSYTIPKGQNDSNGIAVPANALRLNGGTIRDTAGNAANLAHNAVADNSAYRVDTTAPDAPSLQVLVTEANTPLATGGRTSDNTPTLSGSTEPGATVNIFNGGALLDTVQANEQGVWTYTPILGLPNGSYAISVSAVDAAGNAGPRSAVRGLEIDASPLRMESITADNLVSASERLAGVTVRGTSMATAGQIVTLQWGSSSKEAVVQSDGSWNATFLGADAIDSGIVTASVGINGSSVQASQNVTVSTVAPTQTAAITDARDDVGTNGSVGSVASPVTLTNGSSTDDTTPTLTGTLSGALASGEQLVVYDVTGGASTRLGTASVSTSNGTTSWTYTHATAFTNGLRQFAARVENPAADTRGDLSNTFEVNISSVSGITVTDDVGSTGALPETYRYVLLQVARSTSQAWSISELTVLSAGTNVSLGKPVTLGSGVTSTTAANLVNGATAQQFGANALTNGWVQVDLGAWFPIDQVQLANTSNWANLSNTHVFVSAQNMSSTAATVQGLTLLQLGALGARYLGETGSVTTTTGTAVFNYVPTALTSDDATPTLSGTLGAALAVGEEVAIYNGSTKLGVASVNGTRWSFTPASDLPDGSYSLSAVVQSALDGQGQPNTSIATARVVSAVQRLTVDAGLPSQTVSSITARDDVGTNGSVGSVASPATLTSGSSTDDTTPTLSGTLSGPLVGGQQLAIYGSLNGGESVRLGYATVTTSSGTTSWTYTPATALAQGAHRLTAVVENTANGAQSSSAASFDLTVCSLANGPLIDDVGGPATSGYRYVILHLDAPASRIWAVNEVEVWVNGVNVARGKPVIASTSSWTTLPGLVVDGATAGSQITALNNTWIQIDLEGFFNIDQVRLAQRGDSTWAPRLSYTNVFASATDMSGTSLTNLRAGQAGAVFLGQTGLLTTNNQSTLNIDYQAPLSWTTDDTTPTLTGSLGVPPATDEEVAVYSGSAKWGVATVNGTNWTYTPSTNLTDGTYRLTAVVQATGGTDMAAGRVVGLPQIVAVNTGAVNATATLTTATDNANTNGSVGTVATPVTVATGASTDDTTPTLSGAITGTLGAGQVVAIYSELNGISTRLGTASVSGSTWSFTPTVTLLPGLHKLTAVVESTASGAASAPSTALELIVNSVSPVAVSPNAGGLVVTLDGTHGQLTDNATPTLSGTLAAALGSSEELAIYNGNTEIGVATVEGTRWSFTPSSALNPGTYSLRAVVQATGVTNDIAQARVVSDTRTLTVDASAPTQTLTLATVSDNVGTNQANLTSGSSTDDDTPTLSGTILGTLSAGQAVAIYSEFNGASARLGTATVSGSNWSYTPGAALANGAYRFKAVVENVLTGAQGQAQTFDLTVNSMGAMALTDDVGAPAAVQGLRYVILHLDRSSASTWSINEVQVLAGGVNVALGKTVTLSGTDNPGEPARNVVDGNTSGYTAVGNVSTGWVQIDLGGYYNVDQVLLNSRGGVWATRLQNTHVFASAQDMSTTPLANLRTGQAGALFLGQTGTPNNTTDFSLSYTPPSVLLSDDSTPTLSGTLGAPLASGEELAVYGTLGGTTTKLGVATFSGNDWRFTPATPLPDGTHRLQAVVQALNGTDIALARVASPVQILTVDTATPTQTLSLATVSDNVGTHGSVGSVTSPVNLTNGSSTDDSTPALSGSLSTPLTGAQVVAVYDTQGSATQLLGYAQVVGTSWSFTPVTPLASGAHRLTAVVENRASGQQGSSVGFDLSVNSLGAVLVSTDPSTPVLAQGYRYVMLQLDRPLGTQDWSIGEIQAMSQGVNVALGKPVVLGSQGFLTTGESIGSAALVDGSSASYYTSASSVSSGWVQIDLGQAYALDQVTLSVPKWAEFRLANTQVFVSTQDMSQATLAQLRAGAAGAQLVGDTGQRVVNTGVNEVLFTFATPSTLVSADRTPELSGTLAAPLARGEELAIYRTVDGVATKVGVATVTGSSWRFVPGSDWADGSYRLTAAIQALDETSLANARVVSPGQSLTVSANPSSQVVTIAAVRDDASINGSAGSAAAPASVASGTSTDDSTPTLSGTLGAPLSGAQVVAVYDTVNGVATRLGEAVVSGNSWTFTPASPLAAGTHSLTARVENPASGQAGQASEAHTLQVQPALVVEAVNDNVANADGVTVNALATARYVMLQIDRASPDFWGLSELHVLSGGVNVAQGKPVRVGGQGSNALDGFTPHWLVNGQVWDATQQRLPVNQYQNASAEGSLARISSGWLQIDLGAEYAIDRIVLSPPATASWLSNTLVFASRSDLSAQTLDALKAGQAGAILWGGTGTVSARADVALATPAVNTDDNTLTLQGQLAVALGTGEALAVYVNGVKSDAAVTLNNGAWSWTPSTGLSNGRHTVQVVVQDSANTTLANARVLSQAMTVNVDTRASVSQTATFTSVVDDVTGSGSFVGGIAVNGSSPAVSTDDASPLLRGSLGGALLAGEQVVVYNGTQRLGVATVDAANNWSLQVGSPLAAGVNSLKVQVESPATGQVGTAANLALKVMPAPVIGNVTDDVGARQGSLFALPQPGAVRYLRLDANNQELAVNELDVWAWVNGVRTNVAAGKAVTARYAGQTGAVVDGDAQTGYTGADAAPTRPRSGAYTDAWLQVDLGHAYVIDSVVVRGGNNQNVWVSGGLQNLAGFESVTQVAAAPGVTQVPLSTLIQRGGDWNTAQRLVTDDRTPTLSGVLDVALGNGEQLRVIMGGQDLGVAVIGQDGRSWSFTPTTLPVSTGAVAVQVRVLDAAGRVVSASEGLTLDLSAGGTPTTQALISQYVDNVGNVQQTVTSAQSSTDDGTPTLSGSLSAALQTGEVLAVYDGTVRLGEASVTGTGWTFTPASSLALGAHTLTARVENLASGLQGPASQPWTVNVQGLTLGLVADNVGTSQGNVLAQAGLDAARYVRLSRPSGLLDVAEVQVWVRDASGELVNVALGKTLTSNLPGSTGAGLAQAVDGDSMTGYRQGLLPSAEFTGNGWGHENWLQLDLGAAYSIENIVLVPMAGNSNRLMDVVVGVSRTDLSALSHAAFIGDPTLMRQTVGNTSPPTASGVTLSGWSSVAASDDMAPQLGGELGAALLAGERVVVYANGLAVGVATVSSSGGVHRWAFDFEAAGRRLDTGTNQVTVRVEDAAGTARLILTEQLVVDSRNPLEVAAPRIARMTVFDNIGFIQGDVAAGALTDDARPEVRVTLTASLDAVHRVGIYDGESLLGYASGSGLNYSFTPSGWLSFGSHTLSARVVNPVTQMTVDAVSTTLTVQAIRFTEIGDDVGALTGNALARSWNFGLDPFNGAQGFASPSGQSLTDDALPVLKGQLAVALQNGQRLAVFNGDTLLGYAQVDGIGWSYSLQSGQALSVGQNVLNARILDGSGQLLMRSDLLPVSYSPEQVPVSQSGGLFRFDFTETGQSLDLSQLNDAVQPRIDIVSLTGDGFVAGNGNSLKLGLSDVLLAGKDQFNANSGFTGLDSGGRHQMRIDGIPGGSVEVVDGSWTYSGRVRHEVTGEWYSVYNTSSGQLLVDADLSLKGLLPLVI